MAKKSQYELLGIDPHKDGVKKAFRGVVQNIFRHAFVNIVRDPSNPRKVVSKHTDGSGSGSIQRVLQYLEKLDPEVFRCDVDNMLTMNLGDMGAAGFLGPFFVTDTVAINAANVPKDIILKQIAIRMEQLIALYKRFGIDIYFLGGETADLPDQVNTYVLDGDVFASTDRKNVITGEIQPGDSIYGFMSDGRAFWEDADNSGLMANGQTMARYKTMHEMYSRKYPFLCRSGRQFEGRFLINHVPKGLGMSVDHALLSPTRQWAIVIKMLVDELKARKAFHLLHGISMNTGGGATKVLNLGEGIWFNKTMPTPSPIFCLIQQEANESWEGMYPTFNMGVGLDIVGSPKGGVLYQAIRAVSRKSRVRSLKLGKCRRARDGRNHIRLKSEFGTFYYHQK